MEINKKLKEHIVYIKGNIRDTVVSLSNQKTIWKYFSKEWCFYHNTNIKSNTSEYCPFGKLIGKFKTLRQFCQLWNIISNTKHCYINHQIQIFVNGVIHEFNEENVEGGKFTVEIEKEYKDGLFQLVIDGVICKTMKHSFLIQGISLMQQENKYKMSLWVSYLEGEEQADVLNEFNLLILKSGSKQTAHYYSHSTLFFKPSTEELLTPLNSLKESIQPISLSEILKLDLNGGWGDQWNQMQMDNKGNEHDFKNKIGSLVHLLKCSGIISQKTKHKEIGVKEGTQLTVIKKNEEQKKKRRTSLPNALPFKINATPFIPKRKRIENTINKEDKSEENTSELGYASEIIGTSDLSEITNEQTDTTSIEESEEPYQVNNKIDNNNINNTNNEIKEENHTKQEHHITKSNSLQSDSTSFIQDKENKQREIIKTDNNGHDKIEKKREGNNEKKKEQHHKKLSVESIKPKEVKKEETIKTITPLLLEKESKKKRIKSTTADKVGTYHKINRKDSFNEITPKINQPNKFPSIEDSQENNLQQDDVIITEGLKTNNTQSQRKKNYKKNYKKNKIHNQVDNNKQTLLSILVSEHPFVSMVLLTVTMILIGLIVMWWSSEYDDESF
ncbi:hypothetical protein EDI_325400 [Entamoeba dispar SAW760]|uniref:Uncharacterized protein n=1 Tax=Entamoeba dispar (strain ATCC PRA-260 / SAW760) TaxID=370354 RepID=B0EBQ1_ENTDS|nr:uncharacterized protein EDI_325400 [Entamoeba dispar SAW760]EDR28063.1 hypothetical protein EDI_325400 [Entamoeba dispar SAW760]|eukprot:EDR28063.1 hypothetical protein EDI_325400 [Entamoeba dispar SAW760]